MEPEDMARKAAINKVGPQIHQSFTREELHTLLDERGAEWKVVWESIPTLAVFDSLYAMSGFEAFVYDGVLYERKATGTLDGSYYWESDGNEENLLVWVVEHPPFEELVPIADLYQYAQGIEAGASPWLLFQYVTGIAVTSQGMGLNSLMGVGGQDALYLGEALVAYGKYGDSAGIYAELIVELGGMEG